MATYDVPGANSANRDVLAMGCWAEHEDGSLIFVESTEANRVIYSIFDTSKSPPIEYRDAVPETAFKKQFSWAPGAAGDKWTWHDKTPFPWDRIIKAGAQDGSRYAAAERVADSLKLRGASITSDIGHRADQSAKRVDTIWSKISRAVGELRK